jgi:hypothetical protein
MLLLNQRVIGALGARGEDRRNETPAKNHKEWLANPPLRLGEWVDSRVCSDPRIFDDQLAIRRCPPQF